LIAVPVVAAPLAAVRVQDGPAPVAVGPGRAAAERYVRARFHVPQVDASAWKPGLVLNWVVGFGGRSERRIVFFAGGRYLGSDADFGGIGQVGQLGTRGQRAASFALAVYRLQDRPCCPTGRTIEVRFRLAGGRLRFVRPLLRPGIEVAEGLQMPSRNIGCIFSTPSFVRCDVRTGLRPRPPRPAGCKLDWGYGLEMTGRVAADHVLRRRHRAWDWADPCLRCEGELAWLHVPVAAVRSALHQSGGTWLLPGARALAALLGHAPPGRAGKVGVRPRFFRPRHARPWSSCRECDDSSTG